MARLTRGWATRLQPSHGQGFIYIGGLYLHINARAAAGHYNTNNVEYKSEGIPRWVIKWSVYAQTAFPPHIIIVCSHIQHEAVVFNRVARRTELHVYM